MIKISIVFTVFKSEQNIPPLIAAFRDYVKAVSDRFKFEAVFVIDGSPDDSFGQLKQQLKNDEPFEWQICNLVKNIGAPQALRYGLKIATGDYICNMACDQQEPLEFIENAYLALQKSNLEIAYGERIDREDPWSTKLTSNLFWFFYRKLIDPRVPKGGLDMFLISRRVRDALNQFSEKNQFLNGLIMWLGYPFVLVPYIRKKRQIGKSSWTLAKRLRYLIDAIFLFSDLPIRLLITLGCLGMGFSAIFAFLILTAKITNSISVPGYAAIATLISFFGGLNCFGLGIIGLYVWGIFSNVQKRPQVLIDQQISKNSNYTQKNTQEVYYDINE